MSEALTANIGAYVASTTGRKVLGGPKKQRTYATESSTNSNNPTKSPSARELSDTTPTPEQIDAILQKGAKATCSVLATQYLSLLTPTQEARLATCPLTADAFWAITNTGSPNAMLLALQAATPGRRAALALDDRADEALTNLSYPDTLTALDLFKDNSLLYSGEFILKELTSKNPDAQFDDVLAVCHWTNSFCDVYAAFYDSDNKSLMTACYKAALDEIEAAALEKRRTKAPNRIVDDELLDETSEYTKNRITDLLATKPVRYEHAVRALIETCSYEDDILLNCILLSYVAELHASERAAKHKTHPSTKELFERLVKNLAADAVLEPLPPRAAAILTGSHKAALGHLAKSCATASQRDRQGMLNAALTYGLFDLDADTLLQLAKAPATKELNSRSTAQLARVLCNWLLGKTPQKPTVVEATAVLNAWSSKTHTRVLWASEVRSARDKAKGSTTFRVLATPCAYKDAIADSIGDQLYALAATSDAVAAYLATRLDAVCADNPLLWQLASVLLSSNNRSYPKGTTQLVEQIAKLNTHKSEVIELYIALNDSFEGTPNQQLALAKKLAAS